MGRLAATIVAALALAPAALAQSYTVVAVGPFNGTCCFNAAHDINNANQVVGQFAVSPGVYHGYLHSNGVNTDLGTLPGFGKSTAAGINDAGIVTGWSDTAAGQVHAYTYSAGTMKDIGSLPGWSHSMGLAINASGRVVGSVSNGWGNPGTAGALWSASSVIQLPSLGGADTAAHDINATGRIVGASRLASARLHAFTYAAGVMTDLGTLPGGTDSMATALNDDGVIVGYSQSGAQVSAVRWSNSAIASLGWLPGGTWSFANDVNAHGIVVGEARNSAGAARAVRWSGGAIIDLNTEIPAGSGWTLESAAAINDNGRIVGRGSYNGVDRSFMLVPAATDTTPPSVSCGSADGLWHAANASIACTAADSGSGLANTADAAFSLSTSIAAGAESANAATGTHSVCDNAGNCTIAGPATGNKIDRKGPSISIGVPQSTTYPFNSRQLASYWCSDGGSGVASCAGTVASGAGIDTLSVGTRPFNVAAADAVGNAASVVVHYQVAATPWAQFHNGPERSGVQPNEVDLEPGNVGSLQLAWTASTNGPIQSSPVVAEGIVYVTSHDGELYAFSAADGKQLWSSGTIGADLFASPAVADGRVFIGSDDGNVYAFDAASGAALWTFKAGAPIYVPAAVEYGLVYVGAWDGTLYALDESTGTLAWSQSLSVPLRSAVAIADDTVYVGADDLLAFDARSGAPLWAAGLLAINSPPVAYKHYVLVGADDGSLHAFDSKSGGLLWSAMTTYGMNLVAAPAVDGSFAYVGSTDGSLYAFELATGAQVWATDLVGGTGRWLWSSPAFANDVVYVGSGGLSVDAVEAQSGKVLWSYPAPIVYSSPAVADGTVYIGADDGNLYAFRL